MFGSPRDCFQRPQQARVITTAKHRLAASRLREELQCRGIRLINVPFHGGEKFVGCGFRQERQDSRKRRPPRPRCLIEKLSHDGSGATHRLQADVQQSGLRCEERDRLCDATSEVVGKPLSLAVQNRLPALFVRQFKLWVIGSQDFQRNLLKQIQVLRSQRRCQQVPRIFSRQKTPRRNRVPVIRGRSEILSPTAVELVHLLYP